MFRVFVPYVVTLLVVGALVAVRVGGHFGMMLLTDIPFLPEVLMGFVSLYLLVVMMRVLGLLFRCYRARLGWLG